jgi:hypothetical protein
VDFDNTTRVGKFETVKEIIRNTADKHSNVTFIDAYDFVPHSEDLMDDKFVHPSDKGFEYYANALYSEIKKHI